MQIYQSLQGKVDGIVTLVLTGGLGACFDAAKNAREIVNASNVEIVDTRTAMAAQAFVVLQAAKTAASGGSVAEVAAAGRAAMPKTGIFWAMNTLEYLRKGGRVSLPQALMASWLHVKPITGIEEGKVKPLAKTFSRAGAMEKLIDILQERVANYHGNLHLAIVHGDVPQDADKLEKSLAARFKYCELLRSEITPVIGTHVGPGAIGLGYYME